MGELYMIGGSPCSGKSTVAAMLAEQFQLTYFKVDEALERYMKMAAESGAKICKKVAKMSPEEIWMRDPEEQCKEEFMIYEEIFPFVRADIANLCKKENVIAEGAAYLPWLLEKEKISKNRYLTLVPEREFQYTHYRERGWVPYILEGCSDKEKAFENWMERDCLFALRVAEESRSFGFETIVNEGKFSVEEMFTRVAKQFQLIDFVSDVSGKRELLSSTNHLLYVCRKH